MDLELLTFLKAGLLTLKDSVSAQKFVLPNTRGKKPIAKQMTKSVLARELDGTIQLTITIPQNEIKKIYKKVLDLLVTETELPGFRKGKAPRNLVEEKADKTKLYEKVLQEVVPQSYIQSIEEHKLEPILNPKIELIRSKEDEDWVIRAITCEKPKIDLENYKEEVRKELTASKLWIPGKEKKPQDGEASAEEKTQKIIQKLLETIKVSVPSVLAEEELNHVLSNLINQTNSLGLTIDQYLNSIGKTSETIRDEYRKKVINDLSLQFILDRIADEERIDVSDKELDDLIAATGDEKTKENISSPIQRAYIKGVLRRRKALDLLSQL